MDQCHAGSDTWGTLVVIFIFFCERLITFQFRKKEVERNWYFNVLIHPSIEKMTLFYNNADKQFIETLTTLETSLQLAPATATAPDHELLVTKELAKFNSLKRSFEFEVIEPIRIQHPVTGMRLSYLMVQLQDNFIEAFSYGDYIDDKEVLRESFSDYLSANKSAFIRELYIPQQFDPFIKL